MSTFKHFVIFLAFGIVLSEVECMQNNQGSSGFSKKVKGKTFDISNCPTIQEKCSQIQDDLPTIACALNTIRNNKTVVSNRCLHNIWLQISLLVDKDYLSLKLSMPCMTEELIQNCLLSPLPGHTLDCVLVKKAGVRDTKCFRAITKIESLAFNDWQLISGFLSACKPAIEAHTCGRISRPDSLSQTETLRCLEQYEQMLDTDCLSEINTLKQMKYSTLQMDKIVFAACSMEQKTFCYDEVPASWLLYKCLLKHKSKPGMTRRCQDQLFNQQRLMVQNYKISNGLAKSCKEEIRKNRCRKNIAEDKDVRLAQILLCLEAVIKNDSSKVSPECNAEMIDHRKMIMDDYRLSPEILHDCANDISLFCNGVESGGKTIHCLMEHARPRQRKERRISPICKKSLEILIHEADPGEDWRVDPILKKACKPVVDRACREVEGGNGRVMSCLMEKFGTALMTPDCETALLQIQYFVSRDFKLDPQLYKACKYDAVTQCRARLNWADDSDHESSDPLILSCLYKFTYNPEQYNVRLSPACEQQVRRVMRQRANSVDLLPEIEDVCIDDLANHCYGMTGKGEELLCLQMKMGELSRNCKNVVSNFTETQSGHIELNSVISTYCRIPIEKLCSSELKNNAEEDNVLDCLISHKNDPEIKSAVKCRAAIEHQQLISLKSYTFTRKFKNVCRSYVVRFCPKAQTKNQVIICLSEIVRNDTLAGRKHSVTKDCRQQLRSQLFQQRENIDLDPELKEACKKDVLKYCSQVSHGEAAVLECLQTVKGQLSEPCHKAITVVRRQEFIDNAVDYRLVTTCNDMIDLYCHHTNSSKLLDCLKTHRQKADFDEKCKVIVVNRMIEQNTDYRYNIKLQNACKVDIKKYCSEIIANEPQNKELEGKVLYCLKGKFRESQLTRTCENELAEVLKEQALNYRLDPLLGKLCEAEIQTICNIENESLTSSEGLVEECLKRALLSRRIVSAECAREVVQLIEETEVDIEADPLLERACALDLLKYCGDLDHGAGRKLKCLKIIHSDSSRSLEPECQKQLSTRLKMYEFIAAYQVPEGIGDIYIQVSSSPSKKYFLIVAMSFLGLVFIFGLFCGRLTRKAMYVKRK